MTEINWDEQTLPFRCYDCGHQSPTKDAAYEHSEICPGNQRNKKYTYGNCKQYLNSHVSPIVTRGEAYLHPSNYGKKEE